MKDYLLELIEENPSAKVLLLELNKGEEQQSVMTLEREKYTDITHSDLDREELAEYIDRPTFLVHDCDIMETPFELDIISEPHGKAVICAICERAELETISNNEGLELSGITEGANGYPIFVHEVLVGFEKYSDIERLKDKYDFLEVVQLKKRDGHSFYTVEGYSERAYDVNDYLAELGDDWCIYDDSRDAETNAFFEHLEELTDSNKFTSEELKDIVVKDYVEPQNVWKALDQDEVMIATSAHGYFEYEVVNKEMVSFREDVYEHTIGLRVERD